MPSFQTTAYVQAKEKTLAEAIPRGHRKFYIPLNQRPFVWSRDQVAGLWSDFERQMTAQYIRNQSGQLWVEKPIMDSLPHFLGNFIFVERTSANGQQADEVEVFDGQQRITALSMLASCLLDHAEALTKTSNSQDVMIAWSELSKWIFSNARTRDPRVIPDPMFQDLFNCLIVEHRTLQDRQNAIQNLAIDFNSSSNHRMMRDRFLELHKIVADIFVPMQPREREKYIAAAWDVLSRFFICIETTVPSEAFGLRVFSSLNTSATPLSAVDNLKNTLFERTSKARHNLISIHWRSLVQALGAIPPKEFFRRRILSFGKSCSNDDKGLFKIIVETDINGKSEADLVAYVASLAGEAGALSKIRSATGFGSSTQRHLEVVYKQLGASIADVLLLAAYRRFMPVQASEFESAARLCKHFLFRELTICQRDTSIIEAELIKAASAIASGGVAGLRTVLQHASDDARFRKEFEERIEERPKVQFYILFSIEEFLCRGRGMQPFQHSPQQHIEHIVPKKIDKNLPSGKAAWPFWSDRRRRAKHKSYLNRLGNLMLLEANINSSVKNRSFQEKATGQHHGRRGVSKKLGYVDSNLSMARKLARLTITEFAASDIERRQRVLATIALAVWAI